MSADNEEVSPSSAMPDSAKSGSKAYAFKPGRKFGLTGQRQNHHPQQQQVFVNSFTSGGSTTDGRRMSAREEQRNSWMYSLSEQEMEDKYNSICLAIRTENLTLGQRLEHQHAERDLVENNLSQEVRVLHSLFVVSLCSGINSNIEKRGSSGLSSTVFCDGRRNSARENDRSTNVQ